MAYPPQLPPATRTDSTISAGNHAQDHNKIVAALADFIAELGGNPSGAYATLTARLADMPTTPEWEQLITDAEAAVAAAEAAAEAAAAPTDATVAALLPDPETLAGAAVATLLATKVDVAPEPWSALNPQLVRTGGPGLSYDDPTKANRVGELPTANVLAARMPLRFTLPAGAVLHGVAADGRMLVTVNPDGAQPQGTYWTDDGGRTFEPAGFAASGDLVYDSAGNHYLTGRTVSRAPAGTWAFAPCFTFPIGQPAIFNYTEDGEGGVWFAEHYSANDNRSKAVARSTDFGATWTVDSVDYGQRHHHGIHYHKPSGALYLIPGEPPLVAGPLLDEANAMGGGRGVLRSLDKGATWEDVLGRGTSYQPLMGIDLGPYILFGQDASPTAWLLFDTRNNSIRPIRNHAGVGTNPTHAAFVYSQRKDVDGLIYAPGEVNPGIRGIVPLTVLTELDRPVDLLTGSNQRAKTHTVIHGPDRGGHFYLNTSPATSFRRSKVAQRKAIVLGKTPPAIEVYDWDHAPAGATLAETLPDGTKLIRIGEAGGFGGGNWRAALGKALGAPGERIEVIMLVRNVNDAQTDAQTAFWRIYLHGYNSSGAVVATNAQALSLSAFSKTKFQRLRFTHTIPAGAGIDRFDLNINRQFGAAGEGVFEMASKVIIVRNVASDGSGNKRPNDVVYSPTTYEDRAKMAATIGPRTLFRDRIYQLGRHVDWTALNDYKLLELNGVEVGLRRNTTATDLNTLMDGCVAYVKVDGVEVLAVPASQYGSTPDPIRPESTPLALSWPTLTYPRPSYSTRAPLIIGAREGALMLVDPMLGETYTVDVGSRFDGYLEATLYGNAYHVPDLLRDVPAAAFETAIRDV